MSVTAAQPGGRTWRSATGRVRIWLAGAGAAVLGLLPHVLHHAGPLAGAALLGGLGGSLLFGALGLALSVPLLLRVRRRCGNWRLPGLLLATFAIVFSISTFVVGPAISGRAQRPTSTPPGTSQPADPHAAHHR